MFDIGFSELLLFGVIALIVLGPEKLPQAARTAGQWYAKIRRTVSTLQSEIEAELDLAETRQQMQKELAKIRQTEADMRREMADMRGSMQEFESSQNQALKGTHESATNEQDEKKQNKPAEFDYAYGQDKSNQQQNQASDDTIEKEKQLSEANIANDSDSSNESTVKKSDQTVLPMITKPWENMWFRLGAYDKARRLPPPPRLPNYKADILLYADIDKDVPIETTNEPSHENQVHEPNKPFSLNKQETY